MGAFEEGDADYDYEDEGPFGNHSSHVRGVIRQPKTPGLWHQKNDVPIRIGKMRTSHIFSSMRLLEKMVWGQIHIGNDVEKRKMVGAAVREMQKYRELEQEFLNRLLEGKVVLNDLLMGTSRPERKVK